MPKVLTANAFDTGAVVYRAADGWGRNLAHATVFWNDADANQALHQAIDQPKGQTDQVIGAYLIDVEVASDDAQHGKGGAVSPTHIREAIRAHGPTHVETGVHVETAKRKGAQHVSVQ